VLPCHVLCLVELVGVAGLFVETAGWSSCPRRQQWLGDKGSCRRLIVLQQLVVSEPKSRGPSMVDFRHLSLMSSGRLA
jgi:hypothetical protein